MSYFKIRSLFSFLMIGLVAGFQFIMGYSCQAQGKDCPQWGERYTRNMVSDETGLPSSFNIETGKNVKWSVSLGSNGYATPVVAQGKVLMGGK